MVQRDRPKVFPQGSLTTFVLSSLAPQSKVQLLRTLFRYSLLPNKGAQGCQMRLQDLQGWSLEAPCGTCLTKCVQNCMLFCGVTSGPLFVSNLVRNDGPQGSQGAPDGAHGTVGAFFGFRSDLGTIVGAVCCFCRRFVLARVPPVQYPYPICMS